MDSGVVNPREVIEQWERWQRVGEFYQRRDTSAVAPSPLVPVDAVVDALLAEVAHWRHRAATGGVRR